MELYPVYVKAPPPEVPATGTGWVRHTWEREIVEMGKEEIQEMLASEKESCPQLQEPRVIYGDREYELVKIMGHEPFDLYVEGAPYPFTPANIQRRLQCQVLPEARLTPLIWLRVVEEDQPGAGALPRPGRRPGCCPAMQKIWAGCSTPLHFGPAARGWGCGAAGGLQGRRPCRRPAARRSCGRMAAWSGGGPAPRP